MVPIYLDENATTPIEPEVVEAMQRAYSLASGNPASQHQFGRHARQMLDEARRGIAELLGAKLDGAEPDRLLFTSGGTEANNLAVLGIARAAARGTPGQVIISGIEHASVLGPAERLLDEGWRVDTLGADADGVVRVDRLDAMLTDQTRLISVMLANHEIGVIQPVNQLATIARQAGVPLHTDAVQAVGKLPLDFRQLDLAAMSIAAHKFHGPVGIGALFLRGDVSIEPLLFGGHQQEGSRPGTESVALAVGMATALRIALAKLDELSARLEHLRDRFEHRLKVALPNIVVHGQGAPRLPQTSCVALPGVDSHALLAALDAAGVACSAGSACTSSLGDSSPILLCMGVPHELTTSSLRFSLGKASDEASIDEAVSRIVAVCGQLAAGR